MATIPFRSEAFLTAVTNYATDNPRAIFEFGNTKRFYSFQDITRVEGYDPRYWTYSLKLEQYVYAHPSIVTPNYLTRRRVYITDTLEPLIKNKSRHIRAYPEMWGVTPRTDYNARKGDMKYMKNITTITNLNSATMKPMSMRQLMSNLRSVRSRNINRSESALTVNSVLTQDIVRYIEDPEAKIFSEDYPASDSKKDIDEALASRKANKTILRLALEELGIDRVTTSSYFNGVLINYYYSVSPEALNASEFIIFNEGRDDKQEVPIEALRIPSGEKVMLRFATIVRRVLAYLYYNWENSLKDISPYFAVWYTYAITETFVNDKDERVTKRYFEDFRVMVGDFNNISTLDNARLAPEHVEDLLSELGSDTELKGIIVPTHFRAQFLNITLSGGNSDRFRECIERYYSLILNRSKSKNKQVYRMDWCVMHDYTSSTNNGCFYVNLNAVLKHDQSPHAAKRYTDLWKKLSPETFASKSKTFVSDAIEIAARVGYNLTVYDISGELIGGSWDRPGKNLSFVYVDDHYLIIKEFTADMNRQDEVTITKNPRIVGLDYINVYYDIETLTTYENMGEGLIKPYAIAWMISGYAAGFAITENPSIDIFDKMMVDLRGLGPLVNIRMIAYNGSRFDHLYLFRYLLTRGYQVLSSPNSGNKLLKFKVLIPHPDNLYSILEIWDPYNFTMCSLSKACHDFGIETEGKIPFSHDEVQTAYDLGKWKEFVRENAERIREYNIRDVEMLASLTLKVVEALSSATGYIPKFVYRLPTLPSLMFDWWVNERKGRVSDPRLKVCKVKEFKYDLKIRKAVCGGRVEASVGEIIKPMYMVDVVSLYPTVMGNNLFPCGEERIIRSAREAYREFKEGRIGIYYVIYDQTTLSTYHTILPARDLDGRLIWEKHINQGWVPSVTIAQIMEYGGRVQFTIDEDGDSAIVWDNTDYIFEVYVNHFAKIKQGQDRLKAMGLPMNESLRSIGKLILNALSGKMIQRNFPKKRDLIQSKTKLLNELNKTNNWTDCEITELTNEACFLTRDKTEKEMYRLAKPSQIGVFIYAYARAYMFKHIFSKMRVYYTDTDSALISVEDYDLIDESLRCDNREKQFGDFEIETYGQTRVISRAFIFSPKVYCLYDDKGNILKWRAKGVSVNDTFEGERIGDNPGKFFDSLKEDQIGVVKTKQIKRDVKNAKLYTRTLTKTLKPRLLTEE